jgi:hypothetical protein
MRGPVEAWCSRTFRTSSFGHHQLLPMW